MAQTITFYHFKGQLDYVGVNVVSNVNNVYAAKKLMMATYGKIESDIDRTGGENKRAPYFDATKA